MITIWNRKEVFVGYSLQKFNEVRNNLNINNIKYCYKIFNRNSPYLFGSRRGRIGTFGENMEYENTYYIYVHKKDYDYAMLLLRNIPF